jgi:hypothetical protein
MKYTLMSCYAVDIEHKAFIKDTVWGKATKDSQSLRRAMLSA